MPHASHILGEEATIRFSPEVFGFWGVLPDLLYGLQGVPVPALLSGGACDDCGRRVGAVAPLCGARWEFLSNKFALLLRDAFLEFHAVVVVLALRI